MSASALDRHLLLEPLSFLLGAWRGKCEALWTDGLFFEDSFTFSHDGRPLIEFRQVTHGPGGAPAHGECGYLLAKDGGTVHMTIAEPSGITEVLRGQADSNALTLESVEIGHAPGTTEVSRTTRRYFLDEERLIAEVDISVGDEALAPHTRSVLRRVREIEKIIA
ncbi:MAG: heme-binding beta-barrel domain-containing protein [Acidimicrobiales bacterium]